MNKYFLQILIGFGFMVILMVIAGAYKFDKTDFYMHEQTPTTESEQIELPHDDDENSDTDDMEEEPVGKLKADVFVGTLEAVNTGCFADGECFVEVDGKHVTALIGWSRDTVGSVQGVEGFGGLEAYIGKEVEVYAQVNPDGTYTLYGSEGFYIKPKVAEGVRPDTSNGGCVIGGCSSQLCVDADDGEVVSTCEYREEYACYQSAQCKRQPSGQCGWTETAELFQCINENSGGVEMI